MTTDLFTPENTSIQSLLAAFEAALFEIIPDEDGRLIVREDFKVFVALHDDSAIRISSGFSLKDCSEEEALAFCNRINDELIIIRASIDAERTLLYLDWYLPLRGGIAKKAVLRAVRQFDGLMTSVLKLDTSDIVA